MRVEHALQQFRAQVNRPETIFSTDHWLLPKLERLQTLLTDPITADQAQALDDVLHGRHWMADLFEWLESPPMPWVDFFAYQQSIKLRQFQPRRKLIASASYDKTVRLWNLRGEPAGEPFEGHQGAVTSVMFSSDGLAIASGSSDRTVRLWNLAGKPIAEPLRGDEQRVNAVAFSPDGKVLASVDGELSLVRQDKRDYTIRVWDMGQLSRPVARLNGAIFAIAFSPEGTLIATGGVQTSTREKVYLWNVKGRAVGQAFDTGQP